jgi:hypothetical protein
MSTFDRQFEIAAPTWDRVIRLNRTVADPLLLNPNSTSPLAVIDGEYMGLDANGKLVRATAAGLGFPYLEDRGDTGVQVHRKPAVVVGPSGYVAKTVVYTDGLVAAAFGAKLELASFTAANSRLGGARMGLVAFSAGVVIGRVFKSPASLTEKMEYISLIG